MIRRNLPLSSLPHSLSGKGSSYVQCPIDRESDTTLTMLGAQGDSLTAGNQNPEIFFAAPHSEGPTLESPEELNGGGRVDTSM